MAGRSVPELYQPLYLKCTPIKIIPDSHLKKNSITKNKQTKITFSHLKSSFFTTTLLFINLLLFFFYLANKTLNNTKQIFSLFFFYNLITSIIIKKSLKLFFHVNCPLIHIAGSYYFYIFFYNCHNKSFWF